MRVDKYTMAQSWMRQDDATPDEAKATWDTLETEFEDKRKAQLMASAETDAIIKTINDKFGPGTMFPASEAPIPEMTDTQAVMEWENRNRKAGGGRIGFRYGTSAFDIHTKKEAAFKAYKDYKKSYYNSRQRNPIITFREFLPIYAKENYADGGSAGQLVTPSVDGSRPGYAGRPRGFDIEAVETAINNANKNLKYMSLDDVAKQIDGVKTGSQLQGITKKHNLPKLDSFGTKVEKAWIDLFQDSSRNADEVLKPLHKIAEMVGSKSSKTPGRLRVENISLALKNSKNLDYVNDVKPLINKLSSANFIKKIEGKEWRIFDVESSIYSKSMLRAPKTDAEHLMNYVIRHQDQAGGNAVFNIFDEKSGKRITNMKDVDSYHDIIFKDSKGKTYDMDYLLRNSKTDPMFKEYYDLQDQLLEMRDRKYWPDGSKIIDPKTGKHVTFGNYSGSMHQHGYGYTKAYERFPYETDHLNLKKHPFKNLTILPQRINIAVGAADRLKRPDVKYKLGGEHFRNLNVDDLMMQEKDLGKKILIFDKEGTHIGKKLKTPYTAAKIKTLDMDKQIINQLTGGDAKLNKFVSQNFMPSGLSGAYEMLSDDLKKIVNSDGFKTWKAKIANPALTAAGKVARLPTKIFGVADLALGYLDYSNNRQKGWSKEDSIAHMTDTILFGITNKGEQADVAGVKKIAMKNGMSSEVFDQLVAANENQNEVKKIITDFAAQNKDAKERIDAGLADEVGESLILSKNQKDSHERLKVLMAEAIEREPSLKTNLQVQEAGAPIDINVDKGKALGDLSKASYDFVQKRIEDSDLEKSAMYDDTTMGKIGAATKMTIGDPEFWVNLSLGKPWEETSAMKRFEGMHQLKKEDPTMYYKMLLSEGVDPHTNMNIPVHLEWEQKYGHKFGSPISDEIKKSTSYFDGGIASLRRKK